MRTSLVIVLGKKEEIAARAVTRSTWVVRVVRGGRTRLIILPLPADCADVQSQ